MLVGGTKLLGTVSLWITCGGRVSSGKQSYGGRTQDKGFAKRRVTGVTVARDAVEETPSHNAVFQGNNGPAHTGFLNVVRGASRFC